MITYIIRFKKYLLSLVGLGFVLSATAQNPIISDVFTADPAALVANDTVYLYTGHDEALAGGNFYVMNDWQCFTTTDMVNWTSHGEVFNVGDVSWSKGDAWAGQVAKRNGKYYFYFCAEHKSITGKAVGVAVSDSPYGPFKDIGTPLITNNMTTFDSNWDDIDPTIYIEENGQAYMYWGNSQCYYVKLKENMTEIEGDIVKVNLPSYTEAPYIHKYGDTYYLSYAYEWPEKIAYATSHSIEGPWKFQSVLNDNVNNCGTNHQSIIEYKGQWYFIYHTGDIGGDFQRSVAVEYLYYNADGTIKEIIQTRTGVENLDGSCLPSPITPKAKVNDGAANNKQKYTLRGGDNIELSPETTENVDWIWTGPNGYTNNTQSISLLDLQPEQSGVFQASFKNSCGVKSAIPYYINVLPNLPKGIESGKNYSIEALNTGVVLSVENQGTDNGSNVLAISDRKLMSQRFVLTLVDDLYWQVSPISIPTRALDVFNISKEDGANIVLWDYWGGAGQQWQIVEKNDAAYAIVSRNSEKCLTIDQTNNNLMQWTCNDSDNQRFKIMLDDDRVAISETDYKEQMIITGYSLDSNHLRIDVAAFEQAQSLSIVDINGKELFSIFNFSSKIVEPQIQLKTGVFIVKLQANNQVYSQKFFVE